jgi:hypothetical protein
MTRPGLPISRMLPHGGNAINNGRVLFTTRRLAFSTWASQQARNNMDR